MALVGREASASVGRGEADIRRECCLLVLSGYSRKGNGLRFNIEIGLETIERDLQHLVVDIVGVSRIVNIEPITAGEMLMVRHYRSGELQWSRVVP